MEQVLTDFRQALAAGQMNEKVLAHEFAYQGKPLIPSGEGKQPFDYYLPDGRAVEMKLDLRSQATRSGLIEWPTLKRGADFYLHTLTECRVFTHEEYQELYQRGKILTAGQYGYDARGIFLMWRYGTDLQTFIKNLNYDPRQQNN